MKSPISDQMNGGDIRVKRKKTSRSPLSKKYLRFLNNENINLEHSKSKPMDDIKVNVIKKEKEKEVKEEVKEVKEEVKKGVKKAKKVKKSCKRKRVKIKDGVPDQVAMEHNKKCEEEILKNIPTVELVKEEEPLKRKVKKVKKIKKRKGGKKLSKRHTKGRRISFRNDSKKKKGKNIDQEMQSAKKMSDDTIKHELLKSGIIIKGNKKKLMRDIYVFSNLGGINIRKE